MVEVEIWIGDFGCETAVLNGPTENHDLGFEEGRSGPTGLYLETLPNRSPLRRRWTRPMGLRSVSKDNRCREDGRHFGHSYGMRLTRHEGLVQNPLKPVGDGLWHLDSEIRPVLGNKLES